MIEFKRVLKMMHGSYTEPVVVKQNDISYFYQHTNDTCCLHMHSGAEIIVKGKYENIKKLFVNVTTFTEK